MARKLSFAALVLIVASAAVLLQTTDAAIYVVGDTLGWRVPTGGASVYANWSSQHTFAVGDILVFNFLTGQHDLARVTKQSFDGCSSTTPLSLQTVGPANYTLNATGDYYFICTFGQHCSQGQKLTLNVTSNSTSGPTPSPPTSPPPPASTPPSPGTTSPPPPPPPTSASSPGSPISPPSDTTSPPPPPPSNSAPPKSIAAAFAPIFMAIAVAVMY